MKYQTLVVGNQTAGQELKTIEQELVDPALGQVRVKMLRTGVSFGNLMAQDSASKKANPKKPTVLGYEIVGEVDAVGAGVSQFKPGDQVVAYTGGRGGYTQYTYRQPDELVLLPAGANPDQAVCLLLNYMTAYQCMHRLAQVKAGDKVLITGASGGVGSALVELGRLAGLTMYGTASQAKHSFLLEQGVTPIDYKKQNFVEVLHQAQPQGLDYAFDGVGGGSEIECLKVIRQGGRVVSYGMRSINSSGKFDLAPIIFNFVRFFVLGLLPNGKKTSMYLIDSYKRSHSDHFEQDLKTLLQLLTEGKLKPVVAAVMPLSQAQEAHKKLLSGQVVGKIVLDCTR